MMNYELFISWNPDLIICHLGPIAIRWYSTCWLIGLLLAYLIVKHLYKVQKVADEKFDPLFLYCFIGILIGARLGHCIFYEPGYFLSSGQHMVEMLLPIRFTADGSWHFTGYEGLASHGGTLGIIIALLLYCRNMKMNAWFVVDTISIAVPTTACFIRLGNLMNSEIIGKVTDVPWAFIFERVDMLPRHPGQLYEAIAYAIFFFVMWHFWKKHHNWVGTGFFFGLDLALIFTFRFFIEYTKEVQVAFEAGLPIDMGQILSIPFIIIGVACTIGGPWLVKLGAKA
ncbi:MAG: prolipoprotein diacylglyceryl transferase, partial [Prevotella sp.]|nr:prolipoprotein diacylglyceryl transferase [Prevotella sp.]